MRKVAVAPTSYSERTWQCRSTPWWTAAMAQFDRRSMVIVTIVDFFHDKAYKALPNAEIDNCLLEKRGWLQTRGTVP